MYGSQKGFVIVGRDGMLLGTSFSYNLGQVEYRRREVRVPGGPCRRLTVYPGLVWRARVWVGTGRRRTRAPTGGTGHVWFSNNLLGKRSKRFLCGARPRRTPTVHLSYPTTTFSKNCCVEQTQKKAPASGCGWFYCCTGDENGEYGMVLGFPRP